MNASLTKTGERTIPGNFSSNEEYLTYLRHFFVYEFTTKYLNKEDALLEIGCGEGYGLNYLSSSLRRCVGLDVDEQAVNHAKDKYHSSRATFRLYDGKQLPFQKESFNVVVSFQVIEHVFDDRLYLAEAFRVLKKGGVFILTTPNKTYRLNANEKPWNEFHVKEYYPSELIKLLREEFSEVSLEGIFGKNEVQAIEIERVKQCRRVAALDPFNVRRLVPDRIKPLLKKISKSIFPSQMLSSYDQSYKKRYSTNDFYTSARSISKSLDLVGICKK